MTTKIQFTSARVITIACLVLALTLVSFQIPSHVSAAETPGLGGGNTQAPGLGGGNPGSGDTQTTSNGTGLVNPLKNITDLPTLMSALIDGLIQIGTIVLILAFIWVGFLFVRAQGKPEEIKKARSAFVWTIIGGLILLGAKAISTLIASTVSSL